MANVLGELFGDIASAIREKTGETGMMKPAQFPGRISGIAAGTDVSGVTATAEDVLEGKVFVDAQGNEVTGTIGKLSGNTIYLTTDRPYSILQKGYSDGTCKFEVLYGRKEVTPTKETQTFSNSFIKPLVVNPIPDEYRDVSNVTATADDVRAGKVFVDAEGNEVEGALTGTIADVSEVTANAEDVLEGKIIVDSAGKKVMGALAIPEPLLQDKTITENGTYTADSGFDGLGSVIVDVLSSGSTANFVRKSFTATGTWNERISVDFGFKPDFLLIYPSSSVSLGSSNFIFIGYGEKLSQYSTSCFYISSGKFYETARGGSMESTDANKAINRADASGFYFGKSHPAGSYYVVAVGL